MEIKKLFQKPGFWDLEILSIFLIPLSQLLRMTKKPYIWDSKTRLSQVEEIQIDDSESE